MNDFKEFYKISEKASAALKRIKEQAAFIEETDRKLHEAPLYFDKKHLYIEEFKQQTVPRKLLLDGYVYNKLLKNVSESSFKIANEIINLLQEDVISVYEMLNINPKIYGFHNIKESASERVLHQEAERIIYDHFNNNFFNLSDDEKDSRYKTYVVSEAEKLLKEGVDMEMDDIINVTQKQIVTKNLLYKTCFPFFVDNKIKEIKESAAFADFFNTELLDEKLNRIDIHLTHVSKIISLGI